MGRGSLSQRATPHLRIAALSLGLSACSAPAVVAPPARPSTQEEVVPTFVSPARWAYFPREPGQPTARLELPDHRCVVLSDTGDRWLVRGTASDPCKGVATASSSPVYEPLVGVIASGGEFQFISQTGTIYVAPDPLGAFVRYAKPPQLLHQVASAKGAIVGVDESGNAFYFDGGAGAAQATTGSWKRATQPPGSKLFTLGVDDRGRVLAVGVPETVYTSTDGGKTYALAASGSTPRPPHVGALSVSRTSKGALAIEGVMGSLVWGDDGKLTRSTEALSPSAAVGSPIDPSPSPTTTALREGRGQVTGDRYYDLRYPSLGGTDGESPGTAYVLARGPLAGPLEIVPLRTREAGGFSECSDLRLAAHGKKVFVACAHPTASGVDVAITVFVSANGGDLFESVGELETPGFSDVGMGVGADGSALFTNVCRPGGERRRHKAEHDAAEACRPRAAMWIRIDAAPSKPASKPAPKSASNQHANDDAATAKGGDEPTLRATFVQGGARDLGANAFSPVVGAEGKLYFLGRRKKDDRPAIFLSTDGGRSYESRALEAPAAEPSPIDDGTGEQPEVSYGNLDFSGDGTRLTIDDSGTLGLACDSSGGYVWVNADADGRVTTVSPGPEQGASVGGWGRRVVSIGYGATDGVVRAWESNDGGQSFNEITTTAAVGNFFNGDTLMACDAGGCLLGETLARVGWEGQVETPINMAEDFPPPMEPRLRPTLACELSPKSKWTAVKNLTVGPSIYPKLSDLMRGASAWSLMTRDPASLEIDVTSATLPERASDPAEVRTRVLLTGSTGTRGRVATLAKPQAEGFVAAKVVVPESKGRLDAGKPVDQLEVGWVNFYTGTFGRRTLNDAGTWTPSLASGTSLTPALLTVTGPGVVFRAGPAPKSVFFDGGSKSTTFDYPDWSALGLTGPVSSDAALVGGQIFAAGFIDRSPTANIFAIAHKPPGASAFEAEAVTYALGSADVDWVYLGSRNGVSALSTNLDQDTGEAWASIVEPDGSLGERIPIPTLRDVGDRPRPCSADDKKTTPRTVAAAFSRRGYMLFRSGRQPIQVTEGAASPKSLVAADPTWYLSDGAILYGTPKDPCLAGVRGSAVKHGSVVVIAGDLEHAWMFRPATMAAVTVPSCYCNPDDPLCQCADPDLVVDPQTSKPTHGKVPVASVEYRAMTCKLKPELVPPYEVTSNALVRSPEDAQ